MLSPLVRHVTAACAVVLAVGAQAPEAGLEEAYRANNIGVARLEQFDYPAAVAAFRQALAASPDLPIAQLNLALALFYAGDLESARQAADLARTGLPELPHPHYVLGLIARAEDRMDAAVAALEHVRRLDPDDVGAAINLGQVHVQEGRGADAVDVFRVAVAAEPHNVTAAYGLATALLRSGAREEGAAAMRRFQQLRDSGYATAFSQNYLEQGRYAEAIASIGTEPGLVETAVPEVSFRPDAEALGGGARGEPPQDANLRDVPVRVTLMDYDHDGDLDLVEAHPAGIRLYRNERGRFTDVTRNAGLGSAAGLHVLPGDYDNDGRVDLCVLGAHGVALYRQDEPGRFRETKSPGLSYPHAPGAAAWLDVDHDGDLDLYVGGGAPDAPARLFRNNGDGTFTDITTAAGLAHSGRVLAVVPTDYDSRRDIDLLIAAEKGPLLYRNLRDGTFDEVAGQAGLKGPAAVGGIAAGDINKDGFTDFHFAGAKGGTLALSDGRGGFVLSAAPSGAPDTRAAQFIDYDNDGLLDLVALAGDGLRVMRNTASRWEPGDDSPWMDVSARAVPGRAAAPARLASLAAGDLDGDGDLDLVTGGDRPVIWWNEGGARHRSLRVRLSARVSNRTAAGARVEIRAGSLLQSLDVYAASPPPAPADLLFGLGKRPGADVVRVLWPAGILQAEVGDPSRPDDPPAPRAGSILVQELDRKPSSCPYVYTWNGERFEFVTDFLGGGEMGYWVAPGVRNTPDSDEYVRIDGRQLVPRGGRYELRITNELEEALFLDRAELVAIDHPAGVEAHPGEGMTAAPRPFRMHYATGARPPLAAADDRGRDVLDRVAALDRRYVDTFPLERLRGYAAPHSLTLTLPAGEGRLLLLTGWTDYAFSGDNVAAHQAGLSLVPPSLEVKGPDGRWRTAIENIGVPVGRPQTVVVDLASVPASVREVRIPTTMRIYWDQIRVAGAREQAGVVAARLEARAADLRWRGFSAEDAAHHGEPYTYDYERVSLVSPWKELPGRYTREGDVRELLTRTDDRFVVARPGDEIALSFDAEALPAVPAGWTRTFLLYADGFSKEMDLNSSSPDQLSPLPFHGMSRYPYDAPEAYPSTPAHREYLERYNTRVVRRAMPSLDLLVERLGTRRSH